MTDTFGPTVSAEWLAAHLDDPDVAVVDVRWSLDDGPKRAAFEANMADSTRRLGATRSESGAMPKLSRAACS